MANYKPKACEQCGTEFTSRQPNAKYCTPKCRDRAKYLRKKNDTTPHTQKQCTGMRQTIHAPSPTRHILHKEMPKGSRSKTTQAAKARHRKSNQQNLRNMQYHIQIKHPYGQVLFQRMQEGRQTQSRPRIHAQMASRKPRKECRATQTRRPRTTQAAHIPLARATPQQSERSS